MDDDPRLAAAVRQVVRRRQAQRRPQLPRPPRRRRPRRPVAIHWEGEPGDTRTITYADLHRRGAALRQRPEGARRREGRPGQHLPADDPRGGRRHARLRPHRRPHSVVFGGFSAQALADRINDAEAKVLITADGGYRRGDGLPAQAGRRRGARGDADDRARRRRAPRRQRRRDGRRPRPLVPRPRRRRRRRVPGRADGRRGPAVPAVHVGHDRQAQGHHAHDRRLPHAGRLHAQVRVRPPPRDRRLLVHRRRRLGHRPQLHRLRAVRQRHHRS